MKKKLNFIIGVIMTIFLASCMAPAGGGYGRSGGGFDGTLPILIIIGIIILVAVKTSNQAEDIEVPSDQNNKVVNVTLIGGLIGLFGSSPQNRLNSRIKKENANGWRVVQIIPSDSGNIFLTIFRLLLLIITLFLYTTSNGYYVIMERVPCGK